MKTDGSHAGRVRSPIVLLALVTLAGCGREPAPSEPVPYATPADAVLDVSPTASAAREIVLVPLAADCLEKRVTEDAARIEAGFQRVILFSMGETGAVTYATQADAMRAAIARQPQVLIVAVAREGLAPEQLTAAGEAVSQGIDVIWLGDEPESSRQPDVGHWIGVKNLREQARLLLEAALAEADERPTEGLAKGPSLVLVNGDAGQDTLSPERAKAMEQVLDDSQIPRLPSLVVTGTVEAANSQVSDALAGENPPTLLFGTDMATIMTAGSARGELDEPAKVVLAGFTEDSDDRDLVRYGNCDAVVDTPIEAAAKQAIRLAVELIDQKAPDEGIAPLEPRVFRSEITPQRAEGSKRPALEPAERPVPSGSK